MDLKGHVAHAENVRRLKWVLAVVGSIVLVVLLASNISEVGRFLGFRATQQFPNPPEGLLFLAMAAQAPDSSGARIFPVGFYFSNGELRYEPLDKLAESPDGANLAYQHSYSEDSGYITFVGAADIGGMRSFTEIPLQVYRARIGEAASYDDFLERVNNAERLTSSTGIFRQNPSVSNAGEVLYTTHAPGDPRLLFSSPAESWNIRIISLEGEERVLTKGVYPKWVNDTQFIFLKNDGLYLYNLADGTDKRIWGAEGGSVTTRMGIDVSDDAQYIAWSAPDAGLVFLIRALNWATGEMTLKGTLPVSGFSPLFSPDSRLVAVKTVTSAGDAWNVAVEFFEIDTLFAASPPVVLDGVDPNTTSLSDWRP